MDKYFCWACDFSDKTGEGNLARLFVKKKFTQNNYQIFTVNNICILNFINYKILNYKYFSPLIGILFCWYSFIKGKKVVYLNYLPLWNCLLFIFLPPKTILGPITGGAYYKNKFLIRKFLFPFTYKISEFFLILRKTNLCFSTELLKSFLFKSTIKKSNFNYILNYYKKKNIRRKKIDFLIYYRKHKNKEAFFPYDFIKKLILLNFKIHIIGDYFNNRSVINHGYINHKKVDYLLSKTFYSITSDENIYSLFAIECINNNVKILTNKYNKNNIKFFKNNFILVDFNKYILLKNLKIKKLLNTS
jgi:hypothetical protein